MATKNKSKQSNVLMYKMYNKENRNNRCPNIQMKNDHNKKHTINDHNKNN